MSGKEGIIITKAVRTGVGGLIEVCRDGGLSALVSKRKGIVVGVDQVMVKGRDGQQETIRIHQVDEGLYKGDRVLVYKRLIGGRYRAV